MSNGKGLSYSPKVVSALDDNLDGRIRYGLRHAARVAFISLGPSKEYEDQFDWKDQSSASEGEFNTRWNDWKGLYSMSTDARLESIVAFGSMIAGNKRLSGILRAFVGSKYVQKIYFMIYCQLPGVPTTRYKYNLSTPVVAMRNNSDAFDDACTPHLLA
ncbi:hypothetical protein ACNR90_001624 [Candidozyma auris]